MTENRRYYEIYNPQTLEIAASEYDSVLAQHPGCIHKAIESTIHES